jgi:dCTP diphosphatase
MIELIDKLTYFRNFRMVTSSADDAGPNLSHATPRRRNEMQKIISGVIINLTQWRNVFLPSMIYYLPSPLHQPPAAAIIKSPPRCFTTKDGLGELNMTVPYKDAATRIESLESLRDRLRDFAKERDWDQYHTPKNLSMALIAEAAELIEHFQWVEGDRSHLLEDKTRLAVEEELADILIYLVRISDKLGIDLYAAVERKLEINERKYPADKVRGSVKKYTEYE